MDTAKTISKDFKIEDNVLIKYLGNEETVTIPEGVKVIGKRAFANNKGIRKVIIPDNVSQIKASAFESCRELQEVVLGKNVSSLGNSCFEFCKSLSTIDFSTTKVKTLSKFLFDSCDNLKHLDLSKTRITTIKENAFRSSGLDSITLPSKLESIEAGAFADVKISEMTIPATVKNIAYGVFYDRIFLTIHPPKRIVFEGEDAIQFYLTKDYHDTVIVCKKDSALRKMLEKENEGLGIKLEDY